MSRLLMFKHIQQLCCFALLTCSYPTWVFVMAIKTCIRDEIPAFDGQRMNFSLLAPSFSYCLCRTGVPYSRNAQLLPVFCLPSSCSSHSETPVCEAGGKSWRRISWRRDSLTEHLLCLLLPLRGKMQPYLLQGIEPVIVVHS